MTSALPIPQEPEIPQKPSDEATVTDPQTLSEKEVQEVIQLTDEQKKALMDVRKKYKQKYSFTRRQNVRRVSRNFEYLKGNQYIVWDPYTGRFYSPFEENAQGSDSGQDDQDFYKYVNNIIQWLHRVFTASLSGLVPKTRFWPNDADNELDLEAAEEASKAQAYIERQNNIASLLKQELLYMFVSGNYFVYTRYLRDEDRTGSHKEPVYQMQEQEIAPDRFICQQCGAETPADSINPMAQPQCQNCGAPLSESDFFPAEKAQLPTPVDMKDVPNGGVVMTIFNTLHVDMDPRVTDASRDPIYATPILDLEDEADISILRASYPEAWDKFQGQTVSGASATGDADQARIARTKVYSATPGRNLQGVEGVPTFSRCWIQPWAFNVLDDKTMAQGLREKFPKGCLMVSSGETFLDVREEKLTDKWSMCVYDKGLGAYPPAPCDHAISFQDRINDASNATHQYIDRLSNPLVLVNTDLVSPSAMNGMSSGAGGFIGVKPQVAMNGMVTQGLQSAFFQPDFHIDDHIYQYAQELWQSVQILLGITPQMFGGSDPNVQTASGQDQALTTARGIMELTYANIREEHANRAKISVKCLADNETEDINDVTDGDTGFKNQAIRVDKLRGEFSAYPDPDQGYPTTFAQKQEIIREMVINGAKNPIIQKFLEPLVNQKLVAMHIAPEGFLIPGEAARSKTMRDLDQLFSAEPVLMPGPMGPVPMPSITPDAEVDDFQIAIQTTIEFLQKDFQDKKAENPAGFENCRLYLKLLIQMSAQKQMQNAALQAPPEPTDTGGEANA